MAYKRISPQPVTEGGTGATTLTGVVTGNGTSALTANAITQYRVLLGGASNAVSQTAGVGTSGQVLTSNGAGANPTFQNNGNGNVSGPGSSTDNALARWDGTGGDTLQDSTVIVSDNGEMTNSSQPAFLAFLGTTDSDVTGNGADYMLGSGNPLTEVFDQGGNFVTTGTFTAPVTGRYVLGGSFVYTELTAAMTYVVINIFTSNAVYDDGFINIGGARTTAALANAGYTRSTVLADMDAADTFQLTCSIHGGAGNTADVNASARRVNMYGYLAC